MQKSSFSTLIHVTGQGLTSSPETKSLCLRVDLDLENAAMRRKKDSK